MDQVVELYIVVIVASNVNGFEVKRIVSVASVHLADDLILFPVNDEISEALAADRQLKSL